MYISISIYLLIYRSILIYIYTYTYTYIYIYIYIYIYASDDFTIKNCLFHAVKLTPNTNKKVYLLLLWNCL